MDQGYPPDDVPRLFNLREGITRKDALLVSELLDEPSPFEPFKGQHRTRAELTRMLDE